MSEYIKRRPGQVVLWTMFFLACVVGFLGYRPWPAGAAGPIPSVVLTCQSLAVANGNGTAFDVSSYNGALNAVIANGAGTCTVVFEGSHDSRLVTNPGAVPSQNVAVIGVFELWQSDTGTVTSRSIAAGSVSVAANTSYAYSLSDLYPYVRCRIASAAGLGAGSSVTGCSVTICAAP